MSGEVAFAAEISGDRKLSAIIAAGRGDSGKVVIDLIWYAEPRGCAARLGELSEKHDPVAVVVDGRSQAVTLLPQLAELGVLVTQPTTQEVAAAHGQFLDLVAEGGLEHLDQPPLTRAVADAMQRPLAGAQAWERSAGADASPLVAATLAVWGFLGWERVSDPGVFEVVADEIVAGGPGPRWVPGVADAAAGAAAGGEPGRGDSGRHADRAVGGGPGGDR